MVPNLPTACTVGVAVFRICIHFMLFRPMPFCYTQIRVLKWWGGGGGFTFHTRVQPTVMCYKSFSKITLKTEWVHLLSLDSARKLLNLLQLLWSLQHVCHMLRGLTQVKCLIKYPVFQLFEQGCGFWSAFIWEPEPDPNFRSFRSSNWSQGGPCTLTMLSHYETPKAARVLMFFRKKNL